MDTLYLEMLLRSLLVVGNHSGLQRPLTALQRGSGKCQANTAAYESLHVPRGAVSGQPRLRATGTWGHQLLPVELCRQAPVASEVRESSASASPVCLSLMPCSISKQAWVLCICLSSDRRQPPRESRPSFPGPPPGSHTPHNAAWWEQADDQKAVWEHPKNRLPPLPSAIAFHKGAHLDT